jgi:hypothetical protein
LYLIFNGGLRLPCLWWCVCRYDGDNNELLDSNNHDSFSDVLLKTAHMSSVVKVQGGLSLQSVETLRTFPITLTSHYRSTNLASCFQSYIHISFDQRDG